MKKSRPIGMGLGTRKWKINTSLNGHGSNTKGTFGIHQMQLHEGLHYNEVQLKEEGLKCSISCGECKGTSCHNSQEKIVDDLYDANELLECVTIWLKCYFADKLIIMFW